MYGYKAFKKGFKNKYGKEYKLNEWYTYSGQLKYGESGHGIHFSEFLEDTMRFFNPTGDNEYCLVCADGNIIESSNEEYFDSGRLFVADKLIILKPLTREDILNYTLKLDENGLIRMLSLYPFLESELDKIKEYIEQNKYSFALETLLTYQTGDIKTFKRDPRYLRPQKIVDKIIK